MENYSKLILLVIGIFLEFGVLYWSVTFYFVVLRRLELVGGIAFMVLKYLLFFVFVFTFIPLGMLFPIWFAEMIGGPGGALEYRMGLISAGWVVLISSSIFGKRRSETIE